MAEISFGGLATGLPTEDLVNSLMAIERRPLDRLIAEKSYEASRLKAYNQFNEKLNNLRSAVGNLNLTSEVRTTSVRLSSEENISANSTGASTGSYDIAVAQLAQVQKTVTDGLSSDSASILGTGSFSINGEVIEVNSSNDSLQGLMDSINAISGETHDLEDGAGDPLFGTSQVRSAQQAKAYIDGIEVVSNSNTLSGVIAGVTINLNEVSNIITPAVGEDPPVYETTTLNVEADTDKLKEKVSEFVSSYNEIMDWIKSAYEDIDISNDTEDGDSDEEDSLANILRGDATINDVKRNLQSILSDAVGSSGSLQILSEIGISTQMDGTLLLNDKKLDDALEDKFEDVVKLLAGEDEVDGVMKKFNSYLLEATSVSDGMYANKRERYESAIKRLDMQISQKEPLMDKIEERIRSQFNAMELLVSGMNTQSAFLTQQMDMLSNLSRGNQ